MRPSCQGKKRALPVFLVCTKARAVSGRFRSVQGRVCHGMCKMRSMWCAGGTRA